MAKSSYKHLSLEERKDLEQSLNLSDISLKNLAKKLNRSEKCIRYEITHHRQLKVRANQRNKCGRQKECTNQRLCTHCVQGFCKGCIHNNCNELCPDFIITPVCLRIIRYPFTCAGCKELEKCTLPKYFYIAQVSQDQAIRSQTVWKEGPRKTSVEMKRIEEALQDGVKRKMAVEVIINKKELPVSTSTVYRYIKKRHIGGIINIDLKRQVRYKPRDTAKPKLTPIDYDWLQGRKYQDFLERITNESTDTNIWEMDTVLGKKGYEEKAILTLLHRRSNLQIYFLLEHLNSLEVNRIFDAIKVFLGSELFASSFTIILGDNGQEFHDPLSIETYPTTGEKLISVYFCDPRRSDQKGKCEKNHEHLREIFPKGLSLNSLTKKDINYASNMINNYPRPSLNYKSPLEVAMCFLNKKVINLNHLITHRSEKVDLSPILR